MSERSLTTCEQALIMSILCSYSDTEAAAVLAVQSANAAVVPSAIPTFLEFRVEGKAAPAAVPDGPLDTRMLVVDSGNQSTGEVILWVEAGRLSALEFAWYSDQTPQQLPFPWQIRPAT